MKTRKWRTPAILALAVISACFARGVRPAQAEIGGILSGITPELGEGLPLESPVTLTADTVTFDEENGVALAEGNVEVGFGPRTIKADRIRYDMRSGEAEFVGRVRYEQNGDEFSFERIVLNTRTELGAMYNGRIRISSNNYQISSERMEKIGDRSLSIQRGEFTTCPCDPEPDWKFGIRKSTVELDGYAIGRDVTFRIRGVPVLWFPWAAFPVKLKRASGFLLPSFYHSNSKGYSFLIPYYWAINRWSDATFTLETMTRRGPRPEVEYRYVLNNASEGAIRVTYFHDQELDKTRYRYYGENLFRYSEHFFTNARWDIPSDDLYYVDLVDEELLRTARYVPSRGFGAWNGSGDSQALSVVWVEDLQETPDDNTVQRLPEYTGTLLPRTLGNTGLAAGGELQGTYFYRRDGDREVRGRGDASLSRSFTLFPSVVFTPYLSLDFLGEVPTSDETGTRSSGRFVPYAGGNLEMLLRRGFPVRGEGRLVHIINPVVSFRYVPDVDQSNIAIYDMWDRVMPQKQVLLSLQQRLLRITGKGPSEFAFFELSWAFDADDRNPSESPYIDPLSPFVRTLRDQIDLAVGQGQRDDSRDSDVFGLLRVSPAARWNLSGEILFDPSEGDFTTALVAGEWRTDEWNRAWLAYKSTRNLSENVHALAKFRPFRLLGLEASGNYSLRDQELSNGSVKFTVFPRSECWNVGIELKKETRPDQTSFRFTFSLGGIGTVGI